MAKSPRIDKASFGDGVGWLINGGELLGRGGAPLLRVAVVLLLVSLIQAVPLIGPVALMLISPAITAGLLNVFRAVDRGEAVDHRTVLAGLTDSNTRGSLLVLGAVLLVGLFAALAALMAWLSPQMDIQELARLANEPQAMNENPQQLFALFEGVNVFGGLVIAAVIGALTLAALYFAVPLVFFWNWPVLAALLWSVRALLVNWIAFVGFGMVLIGVLLIAGLVFGLFAGIVSLALGAIGQFVVQLLYIALSLFVQLLIAAAQWRAFVRVFPAATGANGSDSDSDSDSGSGSDDRVEL
ncbi:MAG: BPSS1780 family membrane protein [Candidatus Wenzhouxiangella sp. M2_3B_020]